MTKSHRLDAYISTSGSNCILSLGGLGSLVIAGIELIDLLRGMYAIASDEYHALEANAQTFRESSTRCLIPDKIFQTAFLSPT